MTSSVREYAVLYLGARGAGGGSSIGGGNAILSTGQHAIDGPEHTGALDLDELGDVDLTGLSDGDYIVFDLASATWVPTSPTPDPADAVSIVPSSGASLEIDFAVAHWWDITLTDDCTLTIVNPPAVGFVGELRLVFRQGTGGPWGVTYPAAVQWPDDDGLAGGPAPSLHTDEDAQDVVILTTVDAGVTWGGTYDDASPLADYLVGAAHPGLPNAIAVGTTPGGELGGTWASPTVDATHSGSSHAAAQAAAEATAAAALAAHIAASGGAGLLTVDAGSPTYDDSGDDVVITLATVWGYNVDGPYYDSAGAATGEEAILAIDGATGEFVVVPYAPA